MKDQVDQFIDDVSKNDCELEMSLVVPIQFVLGPDGHLHFNVIERWTAARKGATYRAMVGLLAAMIICDMDAMDAFKTWLETESVGRELRRRCIDAERRIVREAIGAKVVFRALPEVSTDSVRARFYRDDGGIMRAKCDIQHSYTDDAGIEHGLIFKKETP
jgi:hypothetical protein